MPEKPVKTGFTPENIIYTPDNIVSFIADLVVSRKPKKILDPACGNASFFPAINSRMNGIPIFTGIDVGRKIIDNAEEKLKDKNLNYHLINSDFFSIKDDLDKYDLIVSQPSFVQLHEAVKIHGFTLLNLEFRFLVECLDLLEENGYLVMILPEQKSFFHSYTHRGVRNYLLDNYSVEASISLHLQTMYPYSSIKTCIFILKNAPQRSKVFFSQYSDSSSPIIIENYLKETFNENCLEGFWVDKNTLKKDNCVWTFDHFRAMDQLKKKKIESIYPLKTLQEIGDVVKNVNDYDELILIPKEPYRNVILKSELENPDDLEKYHQFKLKKENISPQYLMMYLNSDSMKNERNLLSTGTIQRIIEPKGFGSIYIELPDLKKQNRIVYTGQNVEDIYRLLEMEYQDFKRNIFNYPELLDLLNKFDLEDEVFYSKLIWPFSSSYMAVKEEKSPNTILNNYFKFFELIAAFNSIILLSALPKKIYQEQKEWIWQTGESVDYNELTFGKWKDLYARLRGVYQKIGAEKYNILPFGREFYQKITDRKIVPILNTVVKIRNQWTHGGVMPEVCADKIITDMNNYFNTIYESVRVYNPFKLIYPYAMSKNRGIYTIKSRKLEGSQSQFPHYQFETEIDMDTHELYLYDPVTDDRLKIIPELIRLIHCPKCGTCSLYIYNRYKNDELNYISYQYEVHEYKEECKSSFKCIGDLIDY